MPSFSHEAIIELFRSRTTLAPELLEEALAIELPHYSRAVSWETTITQMPIEYTADLVILLEDDRPVFGIVVEVQLSKDADKRYSWPLYAVALRARHKVPVEVLVVTPSENVAEWAREIIPIGAVNAFVPMVLGPGAVPKVTDEAEALRAPEKSVLSAMAHRDDEAIAVAAVNALRGVDDKFGRVCYDLLLTSVSEAVRKVIQAMAISDKYEFTSDWAKQHIAQGREEGREEGREKGRQEGQAGDVLAVLKHRAWTVTPETEQRIRGANHAELERWLLRAVTATNLQSVFEDD